MTDNGKDKAGPTSRQLKEGRSVEGKEGKERNVDCRCKEAEGKTFSQILKIMIKDLAFWKRDGK
jgi:hypothetical protein